MKLCPGAALLLITLSLLAELLWAHLPGHAAENGKKGAGPTDSNYRSRKALGVDNCQDDPIGWYDEDGVGFDCAWYALSNNCEKYGSIYANPDFGDKTANQVISPP